MRDAYVAHITNVLKLAGADEATAAAQAKDVMAFETRLAKVSASSEELSRDVSLYYNPVSVADADAHDPELQVVERSSRRRAWTRRRCSRWPSPTSTRK